MSVTEAELAAACALVALYDERIRLAHEMAQSEHPTGAMAVEVLDAGRSLDEACEAFRRRFRPNAGRVVVGLRQVMAVSPAGRKIHTVYDANASEGVTA